MTNDRRPKPVQRYSRFSHSTNDEVLPPPPPDEPSLTDIAMRALNGNSQPSRRMESRGQPEFAAKGWHQPPPPEPVEHWEEPKPAQPLPRIPNGANGHAPAARTERRRADPLAERTARPRKVEQRAVEAEDAPAAKSRFSFKRAPRPEGEPKQPGALGKTVTAVREKAGPALAKTAFWVAHNLRRREIRKRYNRLLVLGHTRVADRKLEQLFFVPTRKAEQMNPAPDRGIHYDGPVPAAAFNWVMALMPSDLRQFAFIDIRAGRGRTAMLAAQRNFNRILAYEYDPETFDDLQMNVAQYPRSRMTCRNVDCYRGDVDGIRLPDQPCIIYFSNAWREPMIEGAMNYVRETYRQSPRRIYVILENAGDDTALAGDNIFDQIEPPLSERLKLRLLSPMDFKIYRSVV